MEESRQANFTSSTYPERQVVGRELRTDLPGSRLSLVPFSRSHRWRPLGAGRGAGRPWAVHGCHRGSSSVVGGRGAGQPPSFKECLECGDGVGKACATLRGVCIVRRLEVLPQDGVRVLHVRGTLARIRVEEGLQGASGRQERSPSRCPGGSASCRPWRSSPRWTSRRGSGCCGPWWPRPWWSGSRSSGLGWSQHPASAGRPAGHGGSRSSGPWPACS